MTEPKWISKRAVLAMHQEQLAAHGGLDGVRDETLLVFAYDDACDFFRLAASYAFGLARNHAFLDGNKRTALAVSLTFLDRNGWEIDASKENLYLTYLHLAEGTLSEEELTLWLTQHAVPLEP